jgi:uncharacterized protein YjbI with pentapeptide repeats
MDTNQTIKLERIKQRVEAANADISGSAFTDVNLSGATFNNVNLSAAAFNDVNLAGATINDAKLSGLRISQADLRGAAIVESLTDGMTINGIAVEDLFAAYESAHPKGN